MSNIYSDPEDFGLVILKEFDLAEEYEFHKFVFWGRPADGQIFYASDGGCSCPTPFEDYEGLDSLTRLGDGEQERHEAAFKTWAAEESREIEAGELLEGVKIIGDYYREKEKKR